MATEYLGTGALARIFSVSDETIRSWLRRGCIAEPSTAFGMRIFSQEDVEQIRQWRERVLAERAKKSARAA